MLPTFASRLTVPAIVAALLGPAASGPCAFSPPVFISGTGGLAAEIALDKKGNALVVWRQSDGSKERVYGSYRPHDRSFEPAAPISEVGYDTALHRAAFDKKGTALVTWERSGDSNPHLVRAAFRPRDGDFELPFTVSEEPGKLVVWPALAIDKKGNALVVGAGVDGAQASFRPRDGAFEPVATLSPLGTIQETQAAFDKKGNALAVWSRYVPPKTQIEAAFRPADGSFEPKVTLSDPSQNAYEPQVAFDKKGNALAVWWRYTGTHHRVQAAFRPRDGSFAAPVDVSAAGIEASYPRVAFDKKGNAFVVWEQAEGSGRRIYGASRPSGGTFAAPIPVSTAGQNSYGARLAFDKKGNALVVWYRSTGGSSYVIEATSRPYGGAFQPAFPLSTAAYAVSPSLAIDKKGNAFVTWNANDGTSSGVQVTIGTP